MSLPTPSNVVASVIALAVVLGGLGFVYGVGAQVLSYDKETFNLVFGFVSGMGLTVLAFFFGNSKSQERAQEIAAAPPPVDAHPAGSRLDRLAAVNRRLADPTVTGAERERLAQDAAALQDQIARGAP